MSDTLSSAPPSGDDLLTTGEVAALCGVAARTVRRYAAAGKLPAWRTPSGVRRIRRADALALLQPERPAETA